jgi:2-polyprenyl-3-methyl-5-hydroxy-6-metoxy-1,4-benzoquinol methylase
VGYKPSETEPKSLEPQKLRWQLEGPFHFDETKAEEPLFKNAALRRIYTDFLRDREKARVPMLHREDLYESGPASKSPSQYMLELTSKYAGPRVLDVGCGTGAASKELNKKGFNCVGIEWDEDCVKEASQSFNAFRMNAEEMGFADKSFDTVLLFEVLEHLRNPEKALREIIRVARRNLILSVPNLGPLVDCVENNVIMHHFFEMTHLNFFTKSMLERFLGQFFENVLVGEFGPFFVSGRRLSYNLYAVASFEPIES